MAKKIVVGNQENILLNSALDLLNLAHVHAKHSLTLPKFANNVHKIHTQLYLIMHSFSKIVRPFP